MGQMVVRNIPDDVLDRFKREAKRQGKSAEQLAREAIERMAKLNREALLQKADKFRSLTRAGKPIDLVEVIREDRERNR